jgi:hypothetical protein
MNWIRAQAHQPALEMPASSASPSGREGHEDAGQ